MKLSFSAFGLSFAAGFDANEARAARIERAAEIAARVAQIKSEMAQPTN